MESTPILIERGECSSFNRISICEEVNFMAKVFSNSSFSNDQEMSSLSLSSSYYSSHDIESNNNGMFGGDTSSFCINETNSNNLYSLSQGSSLSGNCDSVAYPCQDNYYLSDPDQFFAINGNSMPIEFCLDTKGALQVFPGNPIELNRSLNNLETNCDNNLDASKHEITKIDQVDEEKCVHSSEVERKRYRISEVEKGKRNTRSKRTRKIVSDDGNDSSALNIIQKSGSCSSEEEVSGEKSNMTVADTFNGRTRASRGSATDPQSLYARKRREKINERLRILQRLVPNGTKVDLSTMLEEAVHYVKFLQLQIKLLSSDDLWMYGPLAYNGMDIGLDAKLKSLLSPDSI